MRKLLIAIGILVSGICSAQTKGTAIGGGPLTGGGNSNIDIGQWSLCQITTGWCAVIVGSAPSLPRYTTEGYPKYDTLIVYARHKQLNASQIKIEKAILIRKATRGSLCPGNEYWAEFDFYQCLILKSGDSIKKQNIIGLLDVDCYESKQKNK